MATITDLKKIETSTLQKILEACEKSFPKELSLEEFYSEGQTTWSIPEVGIIYKNTKSKDDLLNFVKTLTDTKNIRYAYATIFEEVENRKSESKEVPRPEDQTRTTLSEDELKQFQEEGVERETKREETVLKSKKSVEEAIKRKQEIYENRKSKEDQINKLKKVVIVPKEEIHTVTLTDQEKEKLYNLKQAVNNDPATVQKIIEEKITKSVKLNTDPQIIKSVTPEVISKTAFSITQNIEALPDYKSISEIPTIIPVLNPVSPLVAISDINNDVLEKIIPDNQIRQEIVDNAQTIAIALDTERSVNVAGANAALNSENLTSIFYGDDNITQFQISENQESDREQGIEIDPQGIYRQGREINSIWKNIINKTATTGEIVSVPSTFITSYAPATNTALAVKSTSFVLKALPFAEAAYGFKQGVLMSQWINIGTSSRPLISSGIQSYLKLLQSPGAINEIFDSSRLILSKPTEFVLGNFRLILGTGKNAIGQQIAGAGIEFGQKFFGIAIAKGGTQAAIQVTSQTGSKLLVGASKLLTKTLTFLSGLSAWATAGISLVARWLLGKIIEKIDWKKFKENFLPVVAIGGGLLIGGPIGLGLLGVGGLIAFNTIRKGIGIAGFFARMGGIFGGIAITIATPVIITLLIIPPTVAFFMFIINSGAYLVPPSSLGSGADNPYMLVTKIAEPKKTSNPNPEIKVNYTVTITALKSILTNIKVVSTKCTVIKKDKSVVKCPSEIIPDIDKGLIISPTKPYTFVFSSDYNSKYSDSIIYDSIEISADTPEEKGIITSGSATVCIGDCPTDCVKVSDNAQVWPSSLRSNSEVAVGTLVSQYQSFMAKVCSNNEEINLCFNPSQITPKYYAWYIHNPFKDNCDAYFNQKGVSNSGDALFLITHELTHHIQKISGSGTSQYLSSGGYSELGGRGFCTYEYTAGGNKDTSAQAESMAEANGLYASIPSWGGCISNYASQYPKNYIFAQNFMR